MQLKNNFQGFTWLVGLAIIGGVIVLGLAANYLLRSGPSELIMEDDSKTMMADENKDTTEDSPDNTMMADDGESMMEDNQENKTIEDSGSMMQEDIEALLEKDNSMMVDDSSAATSGPDAMEGQDTMMEDDVSKKSGPGEYLTYTPAVYAAAAGDKRVLFFHAAWCPFCKAADEDFNANLDKIPAGVTLLKTDYDSEKELKKKYAVTYQHTFVQVDADGRAVTKWNGGGIDELLARVM